LFGHFVAFAYTPTRPHAHTLIYGPGHWVDLEEWQPPGQ
jgi:hypothetical protein